MYRGVLTAAGRCLSGLRAAIAAHRVRGGLQQMAGAESGKEKRHPVNVRAIGKQNVVRDERA